MKVVPTGKKFEKRWTRLQRTCCRHQQRPRQRRQEVPLKVQYIFTRQHAAVFQKTVTNILLLIITKTLFVRPPLHLTPRTGEILTRNTDWIPDCFPCWSRNRKSARSYTNMLLSEG